jgi:hypothetical protein
LTADAPLTDADAAVPALHTAVACRDAASEVAAVSDEGRGFSENLAAAARWCEKRDQAAANAIENIGRA